MMINDLKKYRALVEKCINKSKTAWRNLAKKRKELAPVTPRFINVLNKIKDEI